MESKIKFLEEKAQEQSAELKLLRGAKAYGKKKIDELKSSEKELLMQTELMKESVDVWQVIYRLFQLSKIYCICVKRMVIVCQFLKNTQRIELNITKSIRISKSINKNYLHRRKSQKPETILPKSISRSFPL